MSFCLILASLLKSKEMNPIFKAFLKFCTTKILFKFCMSENLYANNKKISESPVDEFGLLHFQLKGFTVELYL